MYTLKNALFTCSTHSLFMHICMYTQIGELLSMNATYWGNKKKCVTDRCHHQNWKAGFSTNYQIFWNTSKLLGLFQTIFQNTFFHFFLHLNFILFFLFRNSNTYILTLAGPVSFQGLLIKESKICLLSHSRFSHIECSSLWVYLSVLAH